MSGTAPDCSRQTSVSMLPGMDFNFSGENIACIMLMGSISLLLLATHTHCELFLVGRLASRVKPVLLARQALAGITGSEK